MYTSDSIKLFFNLAKIDYTIKHTKKSYIYDFHVDPKINKLMQINDKDNFRFIFPKEWFDELTESVRMTIVLCRLLEWGGFNIFPYLPAPEYDTETTFGLFLKQGGNRYLDTLIQIEKHRRTKKRYTMRDFLEEMTGIPQEYFR